MKPDSALPVFGDSSLTAPDPASREVADRLAAARRDRSINSRVLFAGGQEVVIFHYGESYHLRETRQGKLILTK